MLAVKLYSYKQLIIKILVDKITYFFQLPKENRVINDKISDDRMQPLFY